MTLWRKPVKGDLVRSKIHGNIFLIFSDGQASYYWKVKETFEFVTATPIEPPPEPLRRTVYLAVYKTSVNDKHIIIGGPPIYVDDGKHALYRTSGFEHRVGIIKVELVEGQYDD